MINGEFPSEFVSINATSDQSNDNGFYYNQATITNLEENTKYVYRTEMDSDIAALLPRFMGLKEELERIASEE